MVCQIKELSNEHNRPTEIYDNALIEMAILNTEIVAKC